MQDTYPDRSRPPTPLIAPSKLPICGSCNQRIPAAARKTQGRSSLEGIGITPSDLLKIPRENEFSLNVEQEAPPPPEPSVNYEALSQHITQSQNSISSPYQFQGKLQDQCRYMFFSPATGSIYAPQLAEITLTTPKSPQSPGMSENSQVVQTLPQLLQQTDCWWIDINHPTDAEMKLLAKIFRIHPLTAEDIITQETAEKCEMFRRYYFVNYRSFNLYNTASGTAEALNHYAVVFKDGILTFHFQPNHHARSVLKRITTLKELIHVNADWINYALMDDITDLFAPLVSELQTEVDAIDELVLIVQEAEHTDMLRRIGEARRRVMLVARLLSGKADVMRALIKRSEDVVKGDIRLYLSDVQDHVSTMLNNISHYEKIISRAHSNYLAQISIDLTQVSNRTNDVVAKLTILASVIVPMNLVTGLWGMNVRVPGQDTESLEWFYAITVCFVAMGILIFIYLHKSQVFV